MVKIVCAKPRDTSTQVWSKRQGQPERGRCLEDKNEEQYFFVLPHLLEFLLRECLSAKLHYHTPPSLPTMCINPIGWHHTTENLSLPSLLHIYTLYWDSQHSLWILDRGLIGLPKTLVRNYHYLLCNNPERDSSHLLCARSLKLCNTIDFAVIRDSGQELTEHTQTLTELCLCKQWNKAIKNKCMGYKLYLNCVNYVV